MSALIATAWVYGPQAVAWVIANGPMLIQMGAAAFVLLSQMFG